MHRLLGGILAVAFSVALSAGVDAKQCRDAHGKFVKCKPATSSSSMTLSAKKQCRDSKGHFVKCKKI